MPRLPASRLRMPTDFASELSPLLCATFASPLRCVCPSAPQQRIEDLPQRARARAEHEQWTSGTATGSNHLRCARRDGLGGSGRWRQLCVLEQARGQQLVWQRHNSTTAATSVRLHAPVILAVTTIEAGEMVSATADGSTPAAPARSRAYAAEGQAALCTWE